MGREERRTHHTGNEAVVNKIIINKSDKLKNKENWEHFLKKKMGVQNKTDDDEILFINAMGDYFFTGFFLQKKKK